MLGSWCWIPCWLWFLCLRKHPFRAVIERFNGRVSSWIGACLMLRTLILIRSVHSNIWTTFDFLFGFMGQRLANWEPFSDIPFGLRSTNLDPWHAYDMIWIRWHVIFEKIRIRHVIWHVCFCFLFCINGLICYNLYNFPDDLLPFTVTNSSTVLISYWRWKCKVVVRRDRKSKTEKRFYSCISLQVKAISANVGSRELCPSVSTYLLAQYLAALSAGKSWILKISACNKRLLLDRESNCLLRLPPFNHSPSGDSGIH